MLATDVGAGHSTMGEVCDHMSMHEISWLRTLAVDVRRAKRDFEKGMPRLFVPRHELASAYAHVEPWGPPGPLGSLIELDADLPAEEAELHEPAAPASS